jgi:hypothetical protein
MGRLLRGLQRGRVVNRIIRPAQTCMRFVKTIMRAMPVTLRPVQTCMPLVKIIMRLLQPALRPVRMTLRLIRFNLRPVQTTLPAMQIALRLPRQPLWAVQTALRLIQTNMRLLQPASVPWISVVRFRKRLLRLRYLRTAHKKARPEPCVADMLPVDTRAIRRPGCRRGGRGAQELPLRRRSCRG